MAMQTDVKSTQPLTATGAFKDQGNNNLGRARIKGIYCVNGATAFMLVRREVFVTLEAAHPEWAYYDKKTDRTLSCMFDFQLTEEGYIGEDFLFCDRVRDHGFEVWIDPTITLGHMGVQEYTGNFGNDVLYPMIVPPQKDVA